MAFWNTVLNTTNDVAYGRRLVPTTIDDHARRHPEKSCYSIPRYETSQYGFRDVSWRIYANAINKMAHFIAKEIGRSSHFETVMYLGYPDLRTFIVLVALIKTGHKTLFSSLRNSIAGHAEMIKQTDCKVLLYTAGFPITGILENSRIKDTICVPELEYLLDETLSEPYPYNKTYGEAKHDPCYVVHTSGSTGLPKPVVWTHWNLSTTDSQRSVAPLDDRESLGRADFSRKKRIYLGWSATTGLALGACITTACFFDFTVILGPPDQNTSSVFIATLEHANIDAAFCLSSTLEEVASKPNLLVKFSRLNTVVCIGHLPQDVGDAISQYTTIYCFLGNAETNTIVQHVTDREDWAYACINLACNGVEMRPTADLFELVYVRNPAFADYQGIFKSFPHLQEYSTRDLYSRHPTKPNHWKYEGRSDDIIILRSGWNINPVFHERMVTAHPFVQNCIVVGMRRDKTAAIIELTPGHYTEDVTEQKQLLESIWLQVIKANNVSDDYGQLERRYIMFAKQEKPFQVDLTGTVQRKETINLYVSEIDELYTSIANAGLRGLFRTER